MPTWSLCMIVKNEEAVLERCLNSVKDLMDEIIIVDTGSCDRTKEIAGKFTDRIYEFAWRDDFAAARNFSFSRATGDYLMWLDADDVLPESSLRLLQREKEDMGKDGAQRADVLLLPYQTAFDETGNPVFSYERERIIRRGPECVWVGAVHEVIVPFGRIRHVAAPVRHEKKENRDPDRNLRIYEKLLAENRTLDARQLYYYGRELYFHEKYEKAEEIFCRFLKRPDAWAVNRIEAARLLSYCRYREGREEEALEALFYGLSFGVPRPELCCDIGKHFLDRKKYQAAIFWYETALEIGEKRKSGGHRDETGMEEGFVEQDCRGFLPCIQLCVCYDRLGERRRAEEYNERAGRYRPQSPYYLENRRYFAAGKKPGEDGSL